MTNKYSEIFLKVKCYRFCNKKCYTSDKFKYKVVKMSNKNPTNIGIMNLIRYHFPIQAIVSILHRISGVILFIFIPLVLWAFSISLHSEQSFTKLMHVFDYFWVEFVIWVFMSMLAWHMCSGIKHLLMDLGYFETKISSKIASYVTIIIAIALISLLGVWVW